MGNDIYLIIDEHDAYRHSETLPPDLTGYKQYAGPYAGMVPFSKVYARVSVGGDRVAEICSSHISNGA